MTLAKEHGIERGVFMRKESIVLMEVDLKLFDGAAAAPGGAAGAATAGGSEGQAKTGGSEGTGDAGQESAEPVIKYGKQPEQQTEETNKEGDPENPNQSSESETDGENNDYDLETLISSNDKVKAQFDEKIQNIINKRFKETKSLEERIDKLDPVLDLLKERYDAEDTDQLLETLENETYEELAYKNNMSPEKFKEYKQALRENKELKERTGKQNTEESEKQVQERVKGWYDEATELQKDYPEFNLKEASQNEQFLKLLKADVGVKAAFQATNFDNILQNKLSAATTKTKENTIESIKSKKNRVRENGANNTPGVIVKSDVNSLTAEDRAEIIRRAQNGEEISF